MPGLFHAFRAKHGKRSLTLFKDALVCGSLALPVPVDNSISFEMVIAESALDVDNIALPDLTESILKDGPFAIEHGGYSDIWTGVWKKDDAEVKVAIKALRVSTSDPLRKENLVKVCCQSTVLPVKRI